MTLGEERFLDICLEEVLGEQDPPDLCEKILRTIHRESRGPADEDDQPLSRSSSAEGPAPIPLASAAPGEAPRLPLWERAGRLPRWRRARNLVLATLGVAAVAATMFLAYQESTERLQEEYAQGQRASLLALGKLGLERARSEIEGGEAALASDDAPGARAAASRAQAALELLKRPLTDADLVPELWEAYHLLFTRSLVLRGLAAASKNSEPAIAHAKALLGEALASVPAVDDPRRARVLVALGELQTATGDLSSALETFETALTIAPEDWRLRMARGHAKALREEFDEATHDFTRALAALEADAPPEGSPTSRKAQIARVLLERSAAYGELGELDEAQADATQAEALGPTWRTSAGQAQVHVARGARYEAVDLYRVAISRAPKAAGPLLALSEGLRALAEPVGASRAAQKALALEPSSPRAWVALAEAAELACDPNQARDDAEGALLRAGPLDWRTRRRANRVLARLAAVDGDLDEARERARSTERLSSCDSMTSTLRGELELSVEPEELDLDLAERAFKSALRRRRRSVRALRGLARVLLAKSPKDPGRALRKVEEALATDGRDPVSLAVVAKCYLALRKPKAARSADLARLAARALAKSARTARDPRRPSGRAYALGQRAEQVARGLPRRDRAEQLERARQAYGRAAWLNPFHVQAHVALARLAMERGALARASKHLEAALDADPSASSARELNARLESASIDSIKDLDGARAALKAALELRGADPDLLELKLQLETLQDMSRGRTKAALERAREGFLVLRARAPDELPLVHEELNLLGRLRDACPSADERALVSARRKVVRRTLTDLQEARLELAATGKVEYEQAQRLREAGQLSQALAHAQRAARDMPRDADALALLAELHAASKKPWEALACEIQHAYAYRLTRADALLTLLDVLGREQPGARERFDPVATPLPTDLQTLLEVARAVAQPSSLEQAQAKAAFAALERVIDHDPSHPLPHLLAGYLAAGVQRNEYASRELLFVSTLRPESGQLLILTGLTLARGPADAREDALAVRFLRRALDAGYSWPDRFKDDPGRARLRASPLWRYLREG